MNDNRQLFIEEAIIGAVKRLLSVRVNEIIDYMALKIPPVEFGNYNEKTVNVPDVSLSLFERTEKERIINVDAFSLTITINVPETPDCELLCYAYSFVVCKAFEDNPTLEGIADRVSLTGKKYIKPKVVDCGQCWQVVLSFRITIEGAIYAG
jgi:hypothetical protein